jgi:hypothetical protein
MKPVLITLVIAVGVGLLAGGRLAGLSSLRLRWAPLALAGLALQLLAPAGAWSFPILLISFAMLVAFALANLRIPGFLLIVAGIAMNLSVIAINGGMPVPRWSLERSDQIGELQYLIDHGGAKHHLATSDDHLLFLADVIPIPTPIRQSVSPGDIVAYVGVAFVIVSAMRRRSDEGTEGLVVAEPSVGGEA